MLGAAVPKASINEYDNPALRKCDVRTNGADPVDLQEIVLAEAEAAAV